MQTMQTIILSSRPSTEINHTFPTSLSAITIHPDNFNATHLNLATIIIIFEATLPEILASFERVQTSRELLVFVVLTEQQIAQGEFIPLDRTRCHHLVVDYLIAPVTMTQLQTAFQRWGHVEVQTTLFLEHSYHLKNFFASLPELIWYKNLNGTYDHANQAFLDYFGLNYIDVIGTTDLDFTTLEEANFCKQSDERVVQTQKVMTSTELIAGHERKGFFTITKTPIFNPHNELVGIFGFAKEITDLVHAENEIQFILNSLPFPASVRKLDGTIVQSNPEYLALFETPLEPGANIFDPKYSPSADIRALIAEEDALVIATKTASTIRRHVPIRGVDSIIDFTKTPLIDINGDITHILLLMHDVSELVSSEQTMRELAFSDHLTSLGNRTSLYHILEQSYTHPFGVLFCLDLKGFKEFNSRHGHHVSNAMLIAFADRLQSHYPTDFVCRSGGDEFIIFRTFKSIPSAQDLRSEAETLLTLIEAYEMLDGLHYHLSAHIGIISFVFADFTVDEIISHGEFALQMAKTTPEQIAFYHDDLFASKRLQTAVLESFAVALAQKEIELFYQPQFTCDKVLIGFEGLFRWPNNPYPEFNVAELIDIIETSPLIHELGSYVFHKATRFSQRINAVSADVLTVAVNLSAHQIMAPDFVNFCQDIVKQYDLSPEMLDLEITESVMLDDLDANIAKFQQLKSSSFKVSLDDFGTGYSSLNYLAKLPLTALKIDRSFISEMLHSPQYQTLVQLIINAAHTLGLKVVAEGVESAEELALLKAWHCDFIQGYYFSRPLPETDAYLLVNRK